MTEVEDPGVEEHTPPYMIFVVVFLFFLTGLLGFLICHLLKKKGYRCRTGDMDYEEEEKLGGDADDNEENQDTVEQILKCIIENEANMEAFNEMIGNHNVCVRHDPRLRKESIGGIPAHHHTVHSGSDHNSCHLCAQVRSKKGRRQSRTPRFKQRPGEQTVFSVGRFRVTHHDKKLPGGPNPLVSSGDQLDQSQDSEEQKEGGYNLRSMFKDVRPPLESSNGVAPNVGKRRKSLIVFGRRRGSDPSGIKVGEGTGRETGGVRFSIEQQPVVLEETSQTENTKVAPECGTKPGLKPKTESSKNQVPASPQHEVNTLSSANTSPSQKKIQTHDAISATDDGSNQHGPKPELWTNPTKKSTIGSTAACAPSSLPIPSTASSRQAFKSAEKGEDVGDVALKNKEAFDPGPLQTSTPIDRMHGSFTPVIPTGQTEPFSTTGFPVTQTPPDCGPDLEPGFGASLALISLGSSPPSLSKTKTTSSVSSLITPTSPLSVAPSPKLSSKNMPSQAVKTQLTPTPSPISSALTSGSNLDVLSGSPQTPTSPAEHLSIGNSPHLTLKSDETAEGDLKASSLSAPTDQLCKDTLSNMLLSPSSPTGSKASNVTIVKASPNSKREFSVAIMVEKEESSTSTKDQKGVTSELGIKSEKDDVSQTVSGVGQSESQHEDNSGKQD